MVINSPSGKRLAVGRSMMPGNPKLLAVTCRISTAEAKRGIVTDSKVELIVIKIILAQLI